MTLAENRKPISVALQHASSELRTLKERLERIEHKLEALYFRTDRSLDGEEIGAFQEVDLIVQSTSALADFLEHVASIPGARATDMCLQTAAETVPLRDLAARLQGKVGDVKATGNLELF